MDTDNGNETLPCLRCQTPLTFVDERSLREGGGLNLLFGPLGALAESSLRLELWGCPSCGHVEFFVPGIGE